MYLPRVGSIPTLPRTAAGSEPDTVSRRRRPPNEREQARRRAWGEQWGAVRREHSRKLHEKGV